MNLLCLSGMHEHVIIISVRFIVLEKRIRGIHGKGKVYQGPAAMLEKRKFPSAKCHCMLISGRTRALIVFLLGHPVDYLEKQVAGWNLSDPGRLL